MARTNPHDFVDTLGTDLGKFALLKEIVAKVGGPETEATDDDLDLWWGAVEIDRLASGLTLATINTLSEPSSDGGFAGPWLHKSDESGDHPTHLTSQGRKALRQISALTESPSN